MSDPITIAGKLQFDYKENILLTTSRNYLVREKSKNTSNHLKIKTRRKRNTVLKRFM